MGGERFIRNRDQEMLDDLAQKIEDVRRIKKSSIIRISAYARIDQKTVKQLIYTGKSTTITLLRIIDALNCDIVLIPQKKKKEFFEVEGAEEQLYKLKQAQLKHKKNAINRVTSKREEFDREEFNRDFINDTE